MTREMDLETRVYLRELRQARRTRERLARERDRLQARADRWNAAHPPGTPVVLTDDFGREHSTRTQSIAWVVCDHVSVLVEGRTGGYLLDRIRPDTQAEVDALRAERDHYRVMIAKLAVEIDADDGRGDVTGEKGWRLLADAVMGRVFGLRAELAKAKADLAEAKRLGMKACDMAADAAGVLADFGPTCGAESAAVPPVRPRTLYECRTCSTTTGGGTDGSFDDPRWRRITNIDGPDAICPTCIADPAALDDLREEYPRASIVAGQPTDTPAPCVHLDRAHDGSCFGCGSDENNPNHEATP